MANGTNPSDENGTPKKRGPQKQIAALLVMLALLGVLGFYMNSVGNGTNLPGTPPKPVPAPTLNTATLEAKWPDIVAHAAAPPRGNAQARYTMAEFGDFQCPQCGKVYPVLESLLKKYPAQVNLIFLHRPFPQIHQWALPASQAAEIAAEQGKFWPMYDTLYTSQENLEPGYYSAYAEKIGLDKAKFQAAFNAGQGQSQIKADSAFADSLNVQETPTLLLRDNQAKTVTAYIGTKGTQNADGSPQYPGVQALANNPPWGR
jgi:protein-disulfide isomerase